MSDERTIRGEIAEPLGCLFWIAAWVALIIAGDLVNLWNVVPWV